MRRFLLLLFGSLVFLTGRVLGQNRDVTGTVLDAKGDPVFGASITFRGYNKGTSTGTDGSFRISVPASVKTLVVSGVDIVTQEIDISTKSALGTITLGNRNKTLDEVVVVGYGQSKRTNITGSESTVSGALVADKPFTSPDKALQGEVAGVQVSSASGAPGSNTDVLIRGMGSISASSSPLWVIDGAFANTGDFSLNTTTANVLATLNPDDIESYTVLKDAAATAIYGSRASNGVIVITTKHGKAGKTHINFNAELGSNSIAFRPTNKSCTTLEYQTLLRESIINGGYASNNAQADALITDPNFIGFPANWTNFYTDWLNAVTQKPANQSQYNLSVSGGTEKTTVFASGGYFRQEGTIIASDYTRANGALNFTHKATDWFTLSTVLNGGSSIQHTPTNSGAFANPALAARFLLPWYTPYNTDGTLKFNDAVEFPSGAGPFNPLVQAAYNKATYRQTNIRGNVTAEFRILENLKFTSRYAGEYTDISEDQYRNPFYGDGFADGGDAFAVYTRLWDYTWSNFADWKQRLNRGGDFYLDLKGGYEAYQFNQYVLQAGGQAFPKTLQLQYLASAATPTTASTLPSSYATTSIFSAGDINYKDRYVASASIRRDGSSVFGADHRYGTFYSIGGAWNITEEGVLRDSKTISLLKLRSSYGQLGNQQGFGFYTPLATYGYGFNYHGLPGSAPNNVGNPELTWEKGNTFNVGLDFGFLKNRINGTVEYYNRKTTSLILPVPLSPTSGFVSVTENVGSLSNKGIEFTFDVKPVVTRSFTWDLNFNITHNTNRVVSLFQHKPIASGRFNLTEGHDFQEFYLRQWAGVNSSNGTPQWYTNGSKDSITGSYGAAQQALNYHADPTVYGGLTNTLTYKGLTFSFQLYYNFGNYIYYEFGSYMNSDGAFLGAYNQDNIELHGWQKPGDKVNVPQIIIGGNNNSLNSSTRFLSNGKYIRVRNIELDYNIPKAWLDKAHLFSASVYIRGTNYFTFATDKNIPFDPETGVNSATNFEEYIPRTLVGGIKIGL